MSKHFSTIEPIVDFLNGYRPPLISLNQVVCKIGIDRTRALRIMRKLQTWGYIEIKKDISIPLQGGGRYRNPQWKIADRKGMLERKTRSPKRSTFRDRIWKAMRIKRIFLVKDIIKLAEVKEPTAMNYIHILERNRFVRKTGQRQQRAGCYWHLIKNPGPERPVLKEYPENDVTLSLSKYDYEMFDHSPSRQKKSSSSAPLHFIRG